MQITRTRGCTGAGVGVAGEPKLRKRGASEGHVRYKGEKKREKFDFVDVRGRA
jgi:hypothetical protein